MFARCVILAEVIFPYVVYTDGELWALSQFIPVANYFSSQRSSVAVENFCIETRYYTFDLFINALKLSQMYVSNKILHFIISYIDFTTFY